MRRILFPLAPAVCLMWRRLLYFLWRLKGLSAVCLESAVSVGVLSVAGWTTVVDSVPSPFSENVKSSDAALHFTLGEASSLNEVSLCDLSSAAIPLCVLSFLTSFIRAVRSDQDFGDSQEEGSGLVWSGAPVERVRKDGLLGGSSWWSTASKCRMGGAALESSLDRRAEMTDRYSPSSCCREESCVWRHWKDQADMNPHGNKEKPSL